MSGIYSDQNRVPSPSFLIRKRVEGAEYVILQVVTFPSDFEPYGYERYPLRLGMAFTKEGKVKPINLAAFYKAPRWNNRIYHVLPDESAGRLINHSESSEFSPSPSIDIVALERTAFSSDWRTLVDQWPIVQAKT